MIEGKINTLVSTAIFLLYNEMLSGHKNENGSTDKVSR